jgi:hypothetical protein
MQRQVKDSAELRRILALPWRDWTGDADRIAREVTALLKRPGGEMTLFPQQAVALKEAWENQGALIGLGVGDGKTLISFLLPYVLESQRPLLLTLANLVEKTKRDQRELSKHWWIPAHLEIQSYERLGRLQLKEFLLHRQPDLIVDDEAHRLKNLRTAAVATRVDIYVQARRDPKSPIHGPIRKVVMSGTLTEDSVKNYAHMARWCLPRTCPVPTNHVDIEDWSSALDEDGTEDWERVQPGALVQMLAPGEEPTLPNIRRAYGRRLSGTPGVIFSRNERLGVSLLVRAVPAVQSCPTPEWLALRLKEHGIEPHSRAIDAAFQLLIRKWETPDGRELIEASEVWSQACAIGQGFYHIWDPPPPQEWLARRKAWGQFVRSKRGRKYHSPLDVATHFPDSPELAAWQEIRHVYDETKHRKAVWLCDSVVHMAAAWLGNAQNRHGIVWVKNPSFGRALSEMSGRPYFGRKGRDEAGRYIEDAEGPIIASIDSNHAGRNLQHKWHRNLITRHPSSGNVTEQLYGRTHRHGQKADQVVVEVYTGCAEHVAALWKAWQRAQYQRDTMQQQYRLTYCDLDFPRLDEASLKGPRWDR